LLHSPIIRRRKYNLCKGSFHKSCIKKFKLGISGPDSWTCAKCKPDVQIPSNDHSTQENLPLNSTINLKGCKNGLKLAHINVRDIQSKNKKDDIRWLLNQYQFDVLAITESWLTNDVNSNEFHISGYQLLRKDRSNTSKQTGGGVLVLIKEEYAVDESSNQFQSPVDAIKFTIKKPYMKPVKIVAIYRPSYTPENFFDSLDSELSSLTNFESFFLGDFNLNMHSLIPSVAKFKTIVKNNGFSQMIKNDTRTTAKSSTIIDLILTNNESKVFSAGVIPLSISDHDLIYCIRKVRPRKNIVAKNSTSKYVMTRKTTDSKNLELNSLKLTQAPWWILEHISDANQQYAVFCYIFNYILNLHLPQTKVRVKTGLPVWFDDKVRSLGIIARQKKKLAMKYGTNET